MVAPARPGHNPVTDRLQPGRPRPFRAGADRRGKPLVGRDFLDQATGHPNGDTVITRTMTPSCDPPTDGI
jgi:hypothetical protein